MTAALSATPPTGWVRIEELQAAERREESLREAVGEGLAKDFHCCGGNDQQTHHCMDCSVNPGAPIWVRLSAVERVMGPVFQRVDSDIGLLVHEVVTARKWLDEVKR